MASLARAGLSSLAVLVGAWLSACQAETLEAFPAHYVGIGVELTLEAAGARVVRVIPGGPAARGGLEPGDVVLEIEGHPVRGKALAEIVRDLRGEPGSTVTVRARTAGGDRVVTVQRQSLQAAGDAYRADR